MTDWHGSRLNETFTFRRVSWPDLFEGEDYPQISGGRIEFSALSALKVSGSCDFYGEEIPDKNELIRIYYSFTDDDGETAFEPIATMFCECEEPVYDGMIASGSMELYSVLVILSEDGYGMPYTVTAGINAVAKAKEICESLGLQVNNPNLSGYELSYDHVFDSSASYLDIVNWLLDAAGYSSAWPDANGVVQMAPYIEPVERPVAYTFQDGEFSIMDSKVKLSTETVCNIYHLVYETETETLWATAENADADHPASTVSRHGRKKAVTETVDELPGETQADRINNLKEMARRGLVDKTVETEYVTFSHDWVPVFPNDAVELEYTAAGIERRSAIANMTLPLNAGEDCQTKARRFIRAGFKAIVEGGAL